MPISSDSSSLTSPSMGNRIPLWFWLPLVLLVFPAVLPLLSLAVLVLVVPSDPLLLPVPVSPLVFPLLPLPELSLLLPLPLPELLFQSSSVCRLLVIVQLEDPVPVAVIGHGDQQLVRIVDGF